MSAVKRYTLDVDGSHVSRDRRILLEPAVAASDYDTLASQLAALQSEASALREALQILAEYPLEDFGKQSKADSYPVFGANSWQLNVGHIRKARSALAAREAQS